MAFFSFPFLIFIAITILVYFLVPKKIQWCVLLVASYVFFWINSTWLIFVMFAATLSTYIFGRLIFAVNQKGKLYLKEHDKDLSREEKKQIKDQTKKKAKGILTIGVLIVLCMLLFLKYYNFFGGSLNGLFNLVGLDWKISSLQLIMPLGISFYTLQAIAYLFDVYRNKIDADAHLGRFMLFMSFFPQIVQGPIPRHNQLAQQLFEGHSFDYDRLAKGAQLILWGFMKKLIIADRLATPVNQIFDHYSNYHGLLVFLGAAMYGMQVYADFSGGMDIARGVSQILGIELELNFKQPYFSTSIEDFWRRWHITLGAWMKDYIFYPLSLSKAFGNLGRKSRKVFGQFIGKRLPAFLAMFIVYILVGFWHGPSWNFIAYGIYNGIFIVAGILLTETYEKVRDGLKIGKESITWRLFQIIRTFLIVSVGRYFSRAAGFSAAMAMYGRTLDRWWDLSFFNDGSLQNLGLNTANWILLLAFIIVLFWVDFLHEKGYQIRESLGRQSIIFRWIIILAAVFCVMIFGIYGPGQESAGFIYEQF